MTLNELYEEKNIAARRNYGKSGFYAIWTDEANGDELLELYRAELKKENPEKEALEALEDEIEWRCNNCPKAY